MDLDVLHKQVTGLLTFKTDIEKAMPDILKTVGDVDAVVSDVAKLRLELAPLIAWVEAQQKTQTDLDASRRAMNEAQDKKEKAEGDNGAPEQPAT